LSQIHEITSPTNPKVKFVSSLKDKSSLRKKEGLFVVEGVKIFLEIPENLIESVYVTKNVVEDSKNGFSEEIYNKVLKKLEKIPYTLISQDVAKHMSDTVTPQGIFMVSKMPKYELGSIIDNRKKQIFLVLDEIKDPGNMGTIIRTCEGAGVAAIIMNKCCVDVFNPKVTRSTMGSLFRVPFIIEEDLTETVMKLQKSGITTYAAHLKGKEYFDDETFKGSVAIFIGNEAKGLSDEITKMADKLVKIPMEGRLESLNASVAAAILMYEAKRKI